MDTPHSSWKAHVLEVTSSCGEPVLGTVLAEVRLGAGWHVRAEEGRPTQQVSP